MQVVFEGVIDVERARVIAEEIGGQVGKACGHATEVLQIA